MMKYLPLVSTWVGFGGEQKYSYDAAKSLLADSNSRCVVSSPVLYDNH
jgi:hypothetical protein